MVFFSYLVRVVVFPATVTLLSEQVTNPHDTPSPPHTPQRASTQWLPEGPCENTTTRERTPHSHNTCHTNELPPQGKELRTVTTHVTQMNYHHKGKNSAQSQHMSHKWMNRKSVWSLINKLNGYKNPRDITLSKTHNFLGYPPNRSLWKNKIHVTT